MATSPVVLDFYQEALFFCCIIIYVANFFIGKRKNEMLATQWIKENRGFFERQFAYVGDRQSHLLIRDGYCEYLLYCSGRYYCKSLLLTIRLKSRQDLLTFVKELVWPDYDRLTMEVSLPLKESDDFVFGVTLKSLEKERKAERFDLKTFTRTINHKDVPDKYAVFAESRDMADKLLQNTKLGAILQERGTCFEELYISDQPIVPPEIADYPQIKRIELTLRLNRNEEYSKYHEALVELIDLVGEQGRLKLETSNKHKHSREAVIKKLLKSTEAERLEILESKKVAQQKAQFEKMSPSCQRKYEEKQHKRDLKKRMTGKGKMVVRM